MPSEYEVRVLQYLRDYMQVAKHVKEVVRRIDPDARVFVFGSVVSGKYTGASDIDILVITKELRRKYDIMVEVYRSTEAPVELHVISERQFLRWYRRFIGDNIVEV